MELAATDLKTTPWFGLTVIAFGKVALLNPLSTVSWTE